MSIDEAIAKYKEITNTDANCPAHCNISCDKCVQESEQLVEWLEELKAYRQYIDLTKIPEQYKLGFQDGIIAGNNKALDDFVANVKDTLDTDYSVFDLDDIRLFIDTIEELAEQLKVGVKE